MKKIPLLFLVILLLSNIVQAQIYQGATLYGKQENRLEVLNNFAIPNDTIAPPVLKQNKPHLAFKDGVLYAWNPSTLRFEPAGSAADLTSYTKRTELGDTAANIRSVFGNYVPKATTVTINGDTKNLAGDRTFTVPTIYSSNGGLTDQRTVNMTSYPLTFTNDRRTNNVFSFDLQDTTAGSKWKNNSVFSPSNVRLKAGADPSIAGNSQLDLDFPRATLTFNYGNTPALSQGIGFEGGDSAWLKVGSNGKFSIDNIKDGSADWLMGWNSTSKNVFKVNPSTFTPDLTNYYTRTQLQTSGQALVNSGNITSAPSSWTDNLYNANGTLTGTRQVSMGSNSLSFQGNNVSLSLNGAGSIRAQINSGTDGFVVESPDDGNTYIKADPFNKLYQFGSDAEASLVFNTGAQPDYFFSGVDYLKLKVGPTQEDTVATRAYARSVAGAGGGGMSNPMTTAGDLIIGGTGGAPSRFGIGANNSVLTVISGGLSWQQPSNIWGGGFQNTSNVTAGGTIGSTTPYTAYTGTGAVTFTMPNVVSGTGRAYFIKNASASTITVSAGTTNIVKGDGTSATSLTLAAGQSILLTSNSSVWHSLFDPSTTGITSEADPVWTAASSNYYTKTNLQTSGQASVDWGNVTNVPSYLSGTPNIDAVLAQGGTLSANRTISAATRTLTITGNSVDKTLQVTNTDVGGAAINATSSLGNAIQATSGATAINATANSWSSPAIRAFVGGSNTTAIAPVLQLSRTSTGTATNGMGATLDVTLQNATGQQETASRIQTYWTDIAAKVAALQLRGMYNGADQPYLDIYGNSIVKVASGDTLATKAYARSLSATGTPSGNYYILNTLKTGFDTLSKGINDSTLQIKAIQFTAGSNKLALTKTVTDTTIAVSYDLQPANVALSTLGGSLGVSQINATGTASATTYLRGDGSWATPTVGSGGGDVYLANSNAFTNTNSFASTTLFKGPTNTLAYTPSVLIYNGSSEVGLALKRTASNAYSFFEAFDESNNTMFRLDENARLLFGVAGSNSVDVGLTRSGANTMRLINGNATAYGHLELGNVKANGQLSAALSNKGTETEVVYWNSTSGELTHGAAPAGSGGEANTTSNAGSTVGRVGLAMTKSGVDLPFKSLVAGTNVTFDESVTGEVKINATVGSGGGNLSGTLSVGRIPVASATNTLTDYDALRWDDVNTRVAVSTSTATNDPGFSVWNGNTGVNATAAIKLETNAGYATIFQTNNNSGSNSNLTGFFTQASGGYGFLNSGGNKILGVTQGGAMDLAKITAPATPATGFGRTYVSSADGKLHFISDAGTDYDLTATAQGGATVSSASYSAGTLTLTKSDATTVTATGFPTNNNQLANGQNYISSTGMAAGIVTSMGSNAITTRTLAGTANRITVTNGDLLNGNPTFDIGTDVVTLTGSQTLTNKTLTAPVISSIVNTGTLTVPTVSGTLVQRSSNTTASSATPAPAGDAGQNFYTITALAAAAVFSAPSGTPTDGNRIVVRIKDNGTARGLSWNAIYRSGTDVTLPTTTTVGKTMYVGFIYNAADSKWDCVAVSDGY